MMENKAQPFTSGSKYIDPNAPMGLTQSGIQHFDQWRKSINSIPISVSGENVNGAQTSWALANTPSANVSLVGITAKGPVPLAPGKGNSWNYSINGKQITTAQAFEQLIASYEFQQ